MGDRNLESVVQLREVGQHGEERDLENEGNGTGNVPYIQSKHHAIYIVLKCPDMKTWQDQLLSSKWLSINPLQTKCRPLYLKTQSVLSCEHFSSRL